MKIPRFLKIYFSGMRKFGLNITILINSLLLLFVYLVGIGITSIIAKLFNKSFLDIRIKKFKKSYWTKLDLGNENEKDHYKQY